MNATGTVWTIGHSTREVADFVALLREHAIRRLVDVRRFPGSRRHPQFGSDVLAATLREVGIDYLHAEALGGRRRPRPDSRNGVWRNLAFRGYADHMADADYRAALAEVAAAAPDTRQCLMCAERLWWQCHRSMIADDLVLHGRDVVHVLDPGKSAPHAFREPAHLEGDVPVYGAGQATLL